MYKPLYTLCAGIMLAVSIPALAFAAPTTELHIKSDGTITATNVVIRQKANSNYFARMTWGENAFARIVIVTNEDTKVIKANGGSATRYEMQEGDVLNVEGKLYGLDGSLSITATKIIDFSLLKETKTAAGTITSINSSENSFALTDKQLGNVTIYTTSTTTIQKGSRTILFNELAVGDKILSATGMYDYGNKRLNASLIEVNQDKSVFVPRNFQGVLKSVASTVLPTTITVDVGGTNYMVYLPANVIVLNNAKAATSLTRFVVGDTVRFYGTIRKANLSEIDAEVVRDISF